VDPHIKHPVLRLSGLTRIYMQGGRELRVLDGASADFQEGEAIALVAPSGGGKSTLLQIAGLLDTPDGGSVFLNGRDCSSLSDGERTQIRRNEIGFIYQFHHLLPEFSALENIIIPQLIAGLDRAEAKKRALDLLALFSLVDRSSHRPAELSGGEQQRVAIARAVANAPQVLLADEPTGNLDPETADRVFNQLLQFVRKAGVVALIATHNYDLAARMDRIVSLQGGKLVEQSAAQLAAGVKAVG
jgi:lipoprotein-releasing system ATP-binding protein